MKIKTRELTGAALDWAVAKCEGLRVEHDHQYTEDTFFDGWWQCGPGHWQPLANYSTIWSQAGPIIEREGIDLRQVKQAMFSCYAYYRPEHFPDAEVIMRPNDRGPDRALRVRNKPHPLHGKWMAKMSRGTDSMVQWSKDDFLSDLPLQAAMRCYVASELGAEIDIPDELINQGA